MRRSNRASAFKAAAAKQGNAQEMSGASMDTCGAANDDFIETVAVEL
jgi:hypothetical protein